MSAPLPVIKMRASRRELEAGSAIGQKRYAATEVREQTLRSHACGRTREQETAACERRWMSCPMVAACSGGKAVASQLSFSVNEMPRTCIVSDIHCEIPQI